MYECECCGRRIVPQKLKGIGYLCDDCLPSYIWTGYEKDLPEPEPHYPICPFRAAAAGSAAREDGCALVAVVSGNHYPCRSHDGGKHHFAAYWPACPAPFCKLPPGHRGLHDVPAGKAEIFSGENPAPAVVKAGDPE